MHLGEDGVDEVAGIAGYVENGELVVAVAAEDETTMHREPLVHFFAATHALSKLI